MNFLISDARLPEQADQPFPCADRWIDPDADQVPGFNHIAVENIWGKGSPTAL
jgi:hypothetical protein